MLKALPLLFSKYLEIAVLAVCDIKPCPDNLNKNIPTSKKITVFTVEKKNEANDNKITTKIE